VERDNAAVMLKAVAYRGSRWLAAALLIAVPALADTHFRLKQMKPTGAPVGKGLCEIRLDVAGETEVSLRGDVLSVHTISGRDARDQGSACNEPLPAGDIRGFAFEVKESRGETHLAAPPSSANQYQAIVHIRDDGPGTGRYHFRLTWNLSIQTMREERPQGPPGFVWNNATRYQSHGQGEVTVGDAHLALLDVDAAIDLAGKVWVSFRTARPEPLTFSGMLNARDGGRLRADVVCNGPEWHVQGPMFLTVDEAHNRVTAITLEATDGRDRMRLEWNSKRR